MKILLVSPSTFGYEKRILQAFQDIGCDVSWIDDRIGNDFFSKAATRLQIIKLVPGLIRIKTDHIIKSATSLGVEKIIFINPETLNVLGFQKIKRELPHVDIIIYRWDSLKSKPLHDEIIALSSAVYSFDPYDCERNQKIKHLPLFHSHRSLSRSQTPSLKYQVTFVGTARLRRLRFLSHIYRQYYGYEERVFFYLKAPSYLHFLMYKMYLLYNRSKLPIFRKSLDYDTYLRVIEQSKAILDIEFEGQTGLTMRSIEVLFSNKPLISTNRMLKEYEFYDERHIHVIEEGVVNVKPIKDLINPRMAKLFEKYHINFWARTLAGMQPLQNYFRNGDL